VQSEINELQDRKERREQVEGDPGDEVQAKKAVFDLGEKLRVQKFVCAGREDADGS